MLQYHWADSNVCTKENEKICKYSYTKIYVRIELERLIMEHENYYYSNCDWLFWMCL